jgi:hypothetical protein
MLCFLRSKPDYFFFYEKIWIDLSGGRRPAAMLTVAHRMSDINASPSKRSITSRQQVLDAAISPPLISRSSLNHRSQRF